MPIAVVLALIQILPQLIQAGISIAPLIEKIFAIIGKAKVDDREVTDDEWRALVDHAKSLQTAPQ